MILVLTGLIALLLAFVLFYLQHCCSKAFMEAFLPAGMMTLFQQAPLVEPMRSAAKSMHNV